jgi:hypothetical protein
MFNAPGFAQSIDAGEDKEIVAVARSEHPGHLPFTETRGFAFFALITHLALAGNVVGVFRKRLYVFNRLLGWFSFRSHTLLALPVNIGAAKAD